MNIDCITNEILIAKEVMHTNNVDRIASELQYSPVLILNALYAGERLGKLTYNRKAKTIDTDGEVEVSQLAVSPDLFKAGNDIDLNEQVHDLIANLNGDEIDMSVEELATWMPGITVTKLKMLAFLNSELAMYDIIPPKDKESVFTFLTLKENEGKLWGQKQFKKKKS